MAISGASCFLWPDDARCFAVYVALVDSIAYVADYVTVLQIIDVSSPAAPSILGADDTPVEAYGAVVVVSIASVTDGKPGLYIIDVSSPGAPSLLGSSYNA